MKIVYLKLALLLTWMALAGCRQLPLPVASSSNSEVWTGFLEGKTVEVSSQVGGRLTTLAVAEGDSIQPDQPLAALDDELIRLQIDMSDANVAATEAQVKLLEAGARIEDLHKAAARVDQARAALDAATLVVTDTLAIRANPQTLLVARAQARSRAEVAALQFDAAVNQAQAADLSSSFWQDQTQMLWGGVDIRLPNGATRHFETPTRRVEYAQEQWNQASHDAWEAWAAVTQAQAIKDAAAAALRDVQDQLANPVALDTRVDQARGARDRAVANLQTAQAGLQILRDGASPAQVQAARAAVDQARAARASLENRLTYYKISAPRGGRVSRVYYRVGEVIPASAPIVQLSVEGDLTLRVFVPMSQLDTVHLNDSATITLPELDARTAPATVTHIADQAEFTGRQPQTDSERNAQLIAVELTLKNPDPAIKAGMPGSVSFGRQTSDGRNQPSGVADQTTASSGDSGLLTFSGTLEARETRIASEVAGRVTLVHPSRGDTVNAGDSLIALDDSTIRNSVKEADAAVHAAEANLDQVKEPAQPGTLALADAGVSQAQADLDAAQRAAGDAQRALELAQDVSSQIHMWEGKVSAAGGDITTAEAGISALKNDIELAARDLSAGGKTRLAVLQKQAAAAQANLLAAQATKAGNQQVLDLYRAILKNPLELAASQHAAAAQVKVAQAGLQVAQAEREIARRGPQAEQVALAEAKLDAARASLSWVQAQAKRFAISSPLGGTLIARQIEPGETAQPGIPLLTIADTRELQLTIYVPIRSLPGVRIGQAAVLRLPSLPGRTFPGKVEYIAPEAEFKPANIYNSQERSELVFSVRLQVDNSGGILKAGLPADVTLQ